MENSARDVALTGPVDQRVMNAQQKQATRDMCVSREQRRRKTTMATEMEKTSQRQNMRCDTRQAMKPVMQHDRHARDQMTGFQIEPDMPQPIGQHRMFAPIGIGRERQPACQHRRIDAVGCRDFDRHGNDTQRAGVEIGMPDDPRVRGFPLRMFGESESPRAMDRR